MIKVVRSVVYGIVIMVLVNCLYFLFLAVYKTIHAYILVAEGRLEERPGIHIADALDSFMLALFFIIFALAILKLFLPSSRFLKSYDLPWLKVDNFSELKYIMWEVLLTTMFVFFITKLILVQDNPDWNILIFPGSILMLALAFKLLKHGN
ncbi:MAG: hypothetical protein EOO04_37070 [Chitinophagaceae bacterium]|nr:MAG: hypothetical protein EOO04_37070 [Chitinophagaceae bacterium]